MSVSAEIARLILSLLLRASNHLEIQLLASLVTSILEHECSRILLRILSSASSYLNALGVHRA